ncbi:hypothetical protein BJY01DRAFT_245813 [Aspergillus pseudoustus]|uniref:Uncharacterized protein n=1 Tax=Aspergillus pseudoustus TaxID=1810923 RepID=A0ABR4KCN2_9EURO
MGLRCLLGNESSGGPPVESHYWMQAQRFMLKLFIRGSEQSLFTAITVIRLLAFHDLRLTLTCCRFEWWNYGSGSGQTRLYIREFDQEEAEEIQDEEKEYLEEFEVLLEELQTDYIQIGLPLWEFIQGHWCVRMKDHLSSRLEPMSPDLLCSALEKKVADDIGL